MTRFIRVVPAEVEQHGAPAAIVLAHIRYRCASDGPGRVEREGYRWWRVPRAIIAEETGLTPRAVKHALLLLGDVVPAKEFPPRSDRTLAYRVAESPQSRDQPEDIYVPPGDKYGQGSDKNVTLVGQIRPLHLSPENLKKEGEATGSRQAAAPAPTSAQSANGKRTYHPRCPDHAHTEHPPSCQRCKTVRLAAEEHAVADQARAESRKRARRNEITSCPECDQNGWIETPTGVKRCPRHDWSHLTTGATA